MVFDGRKMIYNFFEYLLAVTLILNCRSMWQHIVTTRAWFGDVLLGILCISVMGCIGIKGRFSKQLFTTYVLYILPLILYCMFFIVFNRYNAVPFIRFIVAFWLIATYFFGCTIEGEIPGVFYKYKKMVVLIAAVSLVFWILGPMLSIIKPTGMVYFNWGSVDYDTAVPTYFGIYFSTQGAISILNIFTAVRNTGIFTEAPMYSFVLSIAFLISVLLEKRSSKWGDFILIMAILSTLSTTGYVVVILVVTAKYLISKPKQEILYYLKVIAIPIVAGMAVLLAYTLMINRLVNSQSGSLRIDDFKAGFKAWISSPLIGTGFGNNKTIISFMSNWRKYNTGFSNSLMQVLFQCGIYIGGIYILGWIRGILNSFKHREILMGIFSILSLFLFVFCVVTYNYLTLSILLFINMRMIYLNNTSNEI